MGQLHQVSTHNGRHFLHQGHFFEACLDLLVRDRYNASRYLLWLQMMMVD